MSEQDDGRRDVRICVVGSSMALGYGDPKALGWVGRVQARTPQDEIDLTVHNLGVRGDTTAGVVERWRSEVGRRTTGGADNRLVVSVGAGDVDTGLSLARTRLNLANVVDEAAADGLKPFVVGPPPRADQSFNDRLRAVVDAERDVCERRSVPFVDCFEPLLAHEQWITDLSTGDGVHPGQAGYGLLAWLVLHCGWPEWLGLEPLP
ncbi:GDSL-type esterase/lipase family protein [Angustibacter sp. McL0619]|uniref:GDSL-type esterase/lipase family protein n=1 Tax=Angustibacter sp. McL0619 TaxID=3415676 RepID=UPI003CEF3B43